MVERIEKNVKILGKAVYISLSRTDCGINVFITGGDQTHIGAVTIVDQQADMWNRCFEGHKDDYISKEWAVALQKKYGVPAVVSVGIHYDQIDQSGINCIVDVMRKQLSEILDVKK